MAPKGRFGKSFERGLLLSSACKGPTHSSECGPQCVGLSITTDHRGLVLDESHDSCHLSQQKCSHAGDYVVAEPDR